MAGRCFIGTSGWTYSAWKTGWYAGIASKTWLEYCSERFTGLEVDGTFYRLQSRETYESWARRTPSDFVFAVRGHRYTTHRKKLIDPLPTILKQRDPAEGLGKKLGIVLWQLPPAFKKNLGRLRDFLEALREWPSTRHSLECRNESWFTDDVAQLLADFGVANCISDAASFPIWNEVTTDVVYVRLHGRPWTYASRYEDPELNQWADRVQRWLAEGRDVHVYFDNDAHGHAPWDATRLLERIAGKAWVERHDLVG